jgi:hypothetical protein
MKVEPGDFCPLLKKKCIGLECSWFIKVQGYNPNTGQQVDEWGCSIAWLPVLLIENSQQQRQTGAAVESFRNEMVRQNEETAKALLLTAAAVSQQANKNILPKQLKDSSEIVED